MSTRQQRRDALEAVVDEVMPQMRDVSNDIHAHGITIGGVDVRSIIDAVLRSVETPLGVGLPPFVLDTSCTACGHAAPFSGRREFPRVEFISGENWRPPNGRVHEYTFGDVRPDVLRRTCHVCGYEWDQATANTEESHA